MRPGSLTRQYKDSQHHAGAYFGCGREEGLKEALGDDPTWMWRWQAAISRRTALPQASDLWRLPLRTREKIPGTRL
jgi:hypothetical protein